LVWDESKLKDTRTCIAWLSPNLWVNGSFYGNVKFAFDWKQLVEGKKFYWVEAIQYSIPAYRILITNKQPSLELEPYRVKDGDGPLFCDSRSNTWYCNQKYTGEFMLDEDLWLQECKAVGFENHHDRTCKKDGSGCSDMGQERYAAGAKLLSRLIGQGVLRGKDSLSQLLLDDGAMHKDAELAWERILRSFGRIEAGGTITHKDSTASPLVTAMLDRLATARALKHLGSLFRNRVELELALRHRTAKALGVRLDKIPGSEE
jgi:hypothetical protein